LIDTELSEDHTSIESQSETASETHRKPGVRAPATGSKPVRPKGVNRSVVRALALLVDVARSPKPQSFAELQKRHQLPKATLHKLLLTLESEDFLLRNQETGKYSLGFAAMEISAGGAAGPGDLPSILSPILQALVEEWNETCHLGILHGGEEVVLKRLDPTRQVVRLSTVVGRRHPAYASAGGLASLAARLTLAEIATMPEKLPQLTKNTISTRKQLIGRLEEVREKGYALDLEEAYPGVRCVGVAVMAPGWPPIHISFSLPLQRASLERLRSLAKPLLTAAHDIEKILAVTPRS
jgi:IclR family acetate operon transcriptional repressor